MQMTFVNWKNSAVINAPTLFLEDKITMLYRDFRINKNAYTDKTNPPKFYFNSNIA